MMEKKKKSNTLEIRESYFYMFTNGVYILAQMVRDPYLVFFNHFNEEIIGREWPWKRRISSFSKAVTRQFLRYSPVAIVKEVTPLLRLWTA